MQPDGEKGEKQQTLESDTAVRPGKAEAEPCSRKVIRWGYKPLRWCSCGITCKWLVIPAALPLVSQKEAHAENVCVICVCVQEREREEQSWPLKSYPLTFHNLNPNVF